LTTALAEHTNDIRRRLATFSQAVLFVLGFSLVFIVGWGGAATGVGRLFSTYRPMLGQIGGLVVLAFGLHTLGVLRIPWLDTDARPDWQGAGRKGRLSAALLGVAFAAGWTPCIGTVLGAILTMAVSQGTGGQAMVLASGYSLGMAIPFLAISLAMDRAVAITGRLRPYRRRIQTVSGLMLMVMGLLLLTNRLFYLAIWAQQNGLYLDLRLGQTVTPTYLIAIGGGLLSFLSPCVLPLVPAYVSYLSGQTFRQ
jgi:cytochrome c-type biogenesis protein